MTSVWGIENRGSSRSFLDVMGVEEALFHTGNQIAFSLAACSPVRTAGALFHVQAVLISLKVIWIFCPDSMIIKGLVSVKKMSMYCYCDVIYLFFICVKKGLKLSLLLNIPLLRHEEWGKVTKLQRVLILVLGPNFGVDPQSPQRGEISPPP